MGVSIHLHVNLRRVKLPKKVGQSLTQPGVCRIGYALTPYHQGTPPALLYAIRLQPIFNDIYREAMLAVAAP